MQERGATPLPFCFFKLIIASSRTCILKDKVWGELSNGEARRLMKMAAKSGNVGIFNKAKEGVLLRGKVSTTTIRAIVFPR